MVTVSITPSYFYKALFVSAEDLLLQKKLSLRNVPTKVH